MSQTQSANLNWKLYSQVLLGIFLFIQVLRWSVSPQFIDIYYHLLTAWGFIQSGGYTGWDFWQYAPVGRMHIYPPLFHLILALFIKLGVQKILLIKILEVVLPVVFLCLLYSVIATFYSIRLSFLVLLFIGSSFSFYLSLSNYLPATLAMVFGLLCLERLFRQDTLRGSIFLALCFYTHIGLSYFFALSFILYGIFCKEDRRGFVVSVICAVILSAPVIFKQVAALKFISISGVSNENKFCEFKVVDSLLGIVGLVAVSRMRKRYLLFIGFFLASLIFLAYPYRFFSGQGYLSIVLLSALAVDFLYERLTARMPGSGRYLLIALILYCVFLSPTVVMSQRAGNNRQTYSVFTFDSVVVNTFSMQHHERISTLLSVFPQKELLSAADIIKAHSKENDIIFSEIYSIGVELASLSGRATANRLFPEIKSAGEFDPIAASKIIILLQDYDPLYFNSLLRKYNLRKIGENRLFVLYENPLCKVSSQLEKASVPYWCIIAIGIGLLILLVIPRKITEIPIRWTKRCNDR